MVGRVRRAGRVAMISVLLPTLQTYQTHPPLQTHPTYQTLPTLLASQAFTVDGASEVVATLHASCEGCDWGVAGREGAAVAISVDGRYRQHVMLTRGETESQYRVL